MFYIKLGLVRYKKKSIFISQFAIWYIEGYIKEMWRSRIISLRGINTFDIYIFIIIEVKLL